MTNYYNILGLEADADIKEIKSSYRKLSKKFHPDLNPDDAFFGKMFLQIQEAYEVLSDEQSRRSYNAKLKTNFSPTTASYAKKPADQHLPIIENFSVDKEEVGSNEEFTVTWKVRNADFVQIRPLGIFPEQGFDKFQFNKLKGKSVNLVLIATNTETGLSVRQHLEILNKQWRPSLFENDKIMDKTILVLRILLIIVIIIFIIAAILFGEQNVPQHP